MDLQTYLLIGIFTTLFIITATYIEDEDFFSEKIIMVDTIIFIVITFIWPLAIIAILMSLYLEYIIKPLKDWYTKDKENNHD